MFRCKKYFFMYFDLKLFLCYVYYFYTVLIIYHFYAMFIICLSKALICFTSDFETYKMDIMCDFYKSFNNLF